MFTFPSTRSAVPQRMRSPFGLRLAVCIGLVLALGADPAGAAALGSLMTSVGFFTALAAVLVINGWPAQLPSSALSAAGALAVAGGAVWLWRAHLADRSTGFVDSSTGLVDPSTGFAGASDRTKAARSAVPLPTAADLFLPESFDHEALLGEFRLHFVRLHDAWDLGATAELQALTTPEMLDELRLGLPAITQQGSGTGRTDVVTLRADLFAFETFTGAFLASVEFSGLMREPSRDGAQPFRELWMLTKSKDGGSGWKLARHQALL